MLSIKVIRSRIGSRYQYSGSMTFEKIRDVTLIGNDYEVLSQLETDCDIDDLEYRQRDTDLKRCKEIAERVNENTEEYFLPSVISIFEKGFFEPVLSDDSDDDTCFGFLKIDKGFFYFADGQHRAGSSIFLDDELKNHSLSVTFIESVSAKHDRQLTSDINSFGKKFDKTLKRSMDTNSILNNIIKDVFSRTEFSELVNRHSNSTNWKKGYLYNSEFFASFIEQALSLKEKELQSLELGTPKYTQAVKACSLFLNYLMESFEPLNRALKAKKSDDLSFFKTVQNETIISTNIFISALGLCCSVWIQQSLLQGQVDKTLFNKLNQIDFGYHSDLIDRAYTPIFKMRSKSQDSINLTASFILKKVGLPLPQEVIKSEVLLKDIQNARTENLNKG
ncbi:DNA sulfur modification protein DndB [Photobacterium leiognathi]|uniref:DNA sulfur modification protein DndB n=1 Tax=Photobacterium leiognathi TaxID=553611 RepID=UPI002981078C|nr:DNA sulfur modification protein DndB [Photobacterium leiognathi]